MGTGINATFPNRLGGGGGGAAGEKCIRYHQNPDEIRFLSKFDPVSYQRWGSSAHHGVGVGVSLTLGGGLGPSQRDIKLRAWVLGVLVWV